MVSPKGFRTLDPLIKSFVRAETWAQLRCPHFPTLFARNALSCKAICLASPFHPP